MTKNLLPNLSQPVQRFNLSKPGTITQPRKTVELRIRILGEKQLKSLQVALMHGANYDDPQQYLGPIDDCGCHLFSENSMAMCLAICSF